MNNLFGSSREMAYRIVLLLANSEGSKFSSEKIMYLDFMCCYSADYNLPFENLYGPNEYRLGELAKRRQSLKDAIRWLVIRGMVNVTVEDEFKYFISKQGEVFSDTLTNNFAKQYENVARNAIEKYGAANEPELYQLIFPLSKREKNVLHKETSFTN